MDYGKQFLIAFGGLKTGNHQFCFDIDDRFFKEFEYSEIQTCALKVLVDMEKQQRMLILVFSISGSVDVVCDRCLDAFPLEIEGKYKLYIKFGSESHEESDDVIVIPEHETRFDIGQYIYEYIILSIPMRHIHDENADGSSGCDPVVLKKLHELKSTETTDPRWEVLKNFKNNP